jgi:hypothetical protein
MAKTAEEQPIRSDRIYSEFSVWLYIINVARNREKRIEARYAPSGF